jgi:hypothetical protein
MQYFITIILIMLFIYFLSRITKKENLNYNVNSYKEGILIKLPKIYFWIGLVGAIFFLTLTILMTIFPDGSADWWVYLIFLFFVFISLSCILAAKKWKINLYENEFLYTTFLGNSYIFSYSDISCVTITQNAIYIKTNRKTYIADPHAIAVDAFLCKIDLYGVEVNNKVVNKKSAIRLSDKIKTLSALNIAPTDEYAMLKLSCLLGYCNLVSQTYYFLLSSLGYSYENNNSVWLPFSNDVFATDEYIYDEKPYEEIIKKLSHISKGKIIFNNVSSNLDEANSLATVKFEANGEHYNLPLKYIDEKLDINIFEKLNQMVDKSGLRERFFISIESDEIIVIFTVLNTATKIDELCGETNFLKNK